MHTMQLTSFRDEYTKLAAKKKEKKKKKDQRTFPISRTLKDERFGGAFNAGKNALIGGAAGGAIGGAKGAIIGGLTGTLGSGLSNIIKSRALLGRARKNQKGFGGSEQKIIKALRATKSGREGSSNPISRALTSVPGMAALGASPALVMAAITASKFGGKRGPYFAKGLARSGAAAAGGAATLGGLTALSRVLNARGLRGENRAGREKSLSQGLFQNDTSQTKILKALKKAKD